MSSSVRTPDRRFKNLQQRRSSSRRLPTPVRSEGSPVPYEKDSTLLALDPTPEQEAEVLVVHRTGVRTVRPGVLNTFCMGERKKERKILNKTPFQNEAGVRPHITELVSSVVGTCGPEFARKVESGRFTTLLSTHGGTGRSWEKDTVDRSS